MDALHRRRLPQHLRLRGRPGLTPNPRLQGSNHARIDTIYRLETPEAIDLFISPAGPVARGLALLIDTLIRQAGVALVGAGLVLAGQLGIGIFLVVFFLAEWFYPVFFEVLADGQTPGKKSMSLRVVNRDGTPVGWSASVIRNLLRFVDFLPLFNVAGLVSMSCSRDFQRLGDLAAGTLVINVREPARRARPPSAPRPEVHGARPPRIPLRADEQRAVLGLRERSAELSAQRVEELADLLAPLTGSRGPRGTEELFRIANGIAGRE